MSYTAEGFFRIGCSFRDIGLESKDLRALREVITVTRLKVHIGKVINVS